MCFFFFFQAEDGIRDVAVTGVQTYALPIFDDNGAGIERDRDSRRSDETSDDVDSELHVPEGISNHRSLGRSRPSSEIDDSPPLPKSARAASRKNTVGKNSRRK